MDDTPKSVAVGAFLERVGTEAQVLQALLSLGTREIEEWILCMDACRGKIATTGVGASGIVARRFAHFLSLIGLPSFYYDVLDAAHGSLASVVRNDLLVAFSKSGQTDELNRVVGALRIRGVPVMAVSCERGPLADLASTQVLLPVPPEADPEGVLVAGSSLLMSAWCDGMVDGLRRLRDIPWGQAARNHPSGAIGRRTLEELH